MSELKALVGKGFIFTGADGIEYECSPYDLNDLAQIEEDYGTVDKLLVETKRFTQVRYMLWLSLRHKHPEITLEDTGRLLGVKEITSLEELLQSFFLVENQEPEVEAKETSE